MTRNWLTVCNFLSFSLSLVSPLVMLFAVITQMPHLPEETNTAKKLINFFLKHSPHTGYKYLKDQVVIYHINSSQLLKSLCLDLYSFHNQQLNAIKKELNKTELFSFMCWTILNHYNCGGFFPDFYNILPILWGFKDRQW